MSRPRMSVTLIVLAVMAGLLTAGSVTAQAPSSSGSTLPYSARLTDPSGQPVADGQYDFLFTLYATQVDDRPLWSEMQPGLRLESGDLKVVLGRSVPIAVKVADRKELWLSVSVRGPQDADFTRLDPRRNLATPQAVSELSCPHSHFSDYWAGIQAAYGLNVDNSNGSGDGVRGYSGSTSYNYAGLYAVNTGGMAAGEGGSGVYGSSINGYGGYFLSDNWGALYARGSDSHYAAMIEAPSGSTNDGLYVNGSLWVTGAKVGYLTDVALNDGPGPLETGDVVAIAGAAAPLAGETPVIRVRKATAADGGAGAVVGGAVVGVVDQGIVLRRGPQDQAAVPGIAGREARLADGTAIRPGEYLLIVTMGAYKGVKVDATLAPIRAGDLLVAAGSSAHAGYAAAATAALPNTVIGKALGELDGGTGLVPVMVTLR
jgi:hypothetical protein